MSINGLALLIAATESGTRDFLTTQFDADGHDVHLADSAAAATAKLCTLAFDVVLLGDFDSPGEAPAWLRALRAGQLSTRVHRHQPVVTIGDGGEAATVRAYEAGSDHHLAIDSTYLVARAVVGSVARRLLEQTSREHLHVGPLHIDLQARTVVVDGANAVNVSNLEFELLRRLAANPTRVFPKAELMTALYGAALPTRTRTLDSHAARLRRKLADGGAHGMVQSSWGVGWRLASPAAP